jgi:hypothetical protein
VDVVVSVGADQESAAVVQPRERSLDDLFGSDFYVVESAMLAEQRRAVHVRAVLGEDVFWRIADTNPASFLGVGSAA